MYEQKHNEVTVISPVTNKELPKKVNDYSDILNFYGLNYKLIDYNLLVGEIKNVQGWILHISVVISQVTELFKVVIPTLISENVPFKIVMDKETCNNILLGYLGAAQIGKIVTIYPDDDNAALRLAKDLIKLTGHFKGPAIPTDILLGSVVYTRYGSFNPIIRFGETGMQEKHIYDYAGRLLRDPYNIPFVLPQNVAWPFEEIANTNIPKRKKVLKHTFKPLYVLKSDVRGNVYKGIYLKGIFHAKDCVIKQGKQNMSSEDSGRNIHDRLLWQQYLYNNLADTVPLPKIFELFQEDGDSYLIMDYIKGCSLYEKIKEINYLSKCWIELETEVSLLFLKYLITITSIIEKLHEKGYVHRDIVPVNFLIDEKGNIFLIDIELAYSIYEQKPDPPFEFGTYGYMSPEQQAVTKPTIKEDIYGLGALILEVITGLSPVKFNSNYTEALTKSLYFLTGDREMAKMIASCLNHSPQLRPSISEIKSSLVEYQNKLQKYPKTNNHLYSNSKSSINELSETIFLALQGMNKSPIITSDDVWYSKISSIENQLTPQNKEYTRTAGIFEGLGGILYMLARVYKNGIDINSCLTGYKKAWNFIEERYLNQIEDISPGLYSGTSGIALALTEGIHARLLDDNYENRTKIKQCLQISHPGMDMANGIAGQSISLMHSMHLLSEESFEKPLQETINFLLDKQNKDGSWIMPTTINGNAGGKPLSLAYGNTGIIWLLLNYISLYKHEDANNAVLKALKWLLKRTGYMENIFTESFLKKAIANSHETGDERIGLILTFVKAYEVLKDENYKKVAEEAIKQYPSNIVNNNFTQQNGLAAMGELYLEAGRVFKSEEWFGRADFIANVFIHTFHRNQAGSGCWIMEERNAPTADFMIGNSGIIHFLARCIYPDKMGYRLLG